MEACHLHEVGTYIYICNMYMYAELLLVGANVCSMCPLLAILVSKKQAKMANATPNINMGEENKAKN